MSTETHPSGEDFSSVPPPAAPQVNHSGDDETVSLTQLVVIIDRDAHLKLPATIFDYELPILEAIYGEDHVYVDSEEDVEVPVMTANEAHEALRRKYSQHVNEVLAIYARPSTLGKATGLEVVDEGNRGKLSQSAVTDHKKEAAKTATKRTAKKTAARK